MKKKILLIDDDLLIHKTLEPRLKQEGFEVFKAQNAREGLRTAFQTHPDLIVMDLKMPGMDGLEATRRLLELADIPIIILTGLGSTADVIKGLSAGADDYVKKPFVTEELVARIRHTLSRKDPRGSLHKSAIYIQDDIIIDLARHRVSVRDKLVDLTPTEFRLLTYLARNRGRIVPHRTLLLEIWGQEYVDQIEYLHLYIRYLRRKIERDPKRPEIIKTERSVGYYIDD